MRERSSVGRLQGLLRPYRASVLTAMAVALLASVTALSVPWFGRWALDLIATTRAAADVNDAFLVLGTLWALSVALTFLRDLLSSRIGHRVTSDLRNQVIAHTLELPIASFDQNRLGDLMSRLTTDSEQLRRILVDDLVRMLGDLIMVVGGTALLLVLDWRLTAALLGVALIAPLAHRQLSPQLRALNRTALDALSSVLSRVTEGLANLRLVKSFGRERHEAGLASKALWRVFEAAVRASRFESFVWTGVYATFGLIALGVIWYGVREVVAGELSIGTMIAYFYTLTIVAAPVTSVAAATARFQRARAAADRIYEVLDEPREHDSAGSTRELRVSRGDIEFAAVSFGYGSGRPVLRDFTLRIRAGETTALVGATGSGKSTVLSLLQRFFEPTSGDILIDGVPIASVSRQSVRATFAVVPQEALLFDDTIRENIRYGRLDASDEDIERVAAAAHVNQFAEHLAAGLDTRIGERGVRLSGGQRQLIAIARAILRDAPILLLDEPTSSLDAQFETYVNDALHTLMAGRTTLIIAHHVRTVAHADQIALLEGGSIKILGTHDELSVRSPEYRDLFAHPRAAVTEP